MSEVSDGQRRALDTVTAWLDDVTADNAAPGCISDLHEVVYEELFRALAAHDRPRERTQALGLAAAYIVATMDVLEQRDQQT